jgi:hypothetical protein
MARPCPDLVGTPQGWARRGPKVSEARSARPVHGDIVDARGGSPLFLLRIRGCNASGKRGDPIIPRFPTALPLARRGVGAGWPDRRSKPGVEKGGYAVAGFVRNIRSSATSLVSSGRPRPHARRSSQGRMARGVRPFHPPVPWPALSDTPQREANLPTSGPRPFLWIFRPFRKGFGQVSAALKSRAIPSLGRPNPL